MCCFVEGFVFPYQCSWRSIHFNSNISVILITGIRFAGLIVQPLICRKDECMYYSSIYCCLKLFNFKILDSHFTFHENLCDLAEMRDLCNHLERKNAGLRFFNMQITILASVFFPFSNGFFFFFFVHLFLQNLPLSSLRLSYVLYSITLHCTGHYFLQIMPKKLANDSQQIIHSLSLHDTLCLRNAWNKWNPHSMWSLFFFKWFYFFSSDHTP